MIMFPLRYSSFFILPVLLLQSICAAGQNVVFTATAGASKMGLNDQIEVSYTIRDAENLQGIGPGNLKDFVIVGGPFQSQSSNITVSGGRTVQTMSVSLTYVMQPRHTGNLTIPAGMAKDAGGNTYQSNPINIQVVPGSLAKQQRRQQAGQFDPFGDDPFGGDPFAAIRQRMQQGRQQGLNQRPQQQQQQPAAPSVSMEDIHKDLFIKVVVDKQSVHIGEQLTATYKLYARLPMQVGISKLPSLNGFWTQDFDLPKQPKPVEETVNGKKYQVFLLKKSALFPQQTGKLMLDPAEAEGSVRIIQKVRNQNPFGDLFDDPFFRQALGGSMAMNDPMFNEDVFGGAAYKDVPVHLKSIPVAINILPLPDKNTPADFGGAVGNFTIVAKLDQQKLTTDGAATLTLMINGTGNFKLIQAPKLQLPNGLDAYEPQVLDTITGRTNAISGSKIITYNIAPRTPGSYTIPAIPFSYYNPQSGSYVTLHTQPFNLQVTPGKNYHPAALAKLAPGLKDIHDNVLRAPASFAPAMVKPLILTPGYWSLYALPLLALLGVGIWRKREDELQGNSILLKNKRANKIAHKRLATAKLILQGGVKNGSFYEEISKAIWLYLSDKLSIPLSGLSRETALSELTNRGIPAQMLHELQQVTEDCEVALYSPSGGRQHMQQTYEAAVVLISKLEDHLQA